MTVVVVPVCPVSSLVLIAHLCSVEEHEFNLKHQFSSVLVSSDLKNEIRSHIITDQYLEYLIGHRNMLKFKIKTQLVVSF